MRRSPRLLAATAAFALLGAASACGGNDPGSDAAPAASSGSTSGPASAKEVASVSSVRPKITALVTALQSKDLASSRAAYEDYDAAWNGVEVYVNVRDIDLYTTLEKNLQDPIGEALGKDSPDYAALVPTAQKLGTTYDRAIANSKAGPALSPLFDDVTQLRVVRSDLRRATSAIDRGDVGSAKQHFDTFAGNYPTVKPLVTGRSDTADGPIDAAITAAQKEFGESDATADELDPLLENVTTSYNFAVSLANVAARNADPSRTSVTQSDVDSARTLAQVAASLTASRKSWTAGDYAAARKSAGEADESFEKVESALKGKKAAPELEDAIDKYAGEAGAAGDTTKVTADATTAIQDAQVAQQAFVGQFWPTVKDQITS